MTKTADEFKRGDTLSIGVALPTGWVTPDYDIAAQIRLPATNPRDESSKVADCEVLISDNTHIVLRVMNTETFPIAVLAFDIQFTHKVTGYVTSTETVELPVVRDYTL